MTQTTTDTRMTRARSITGERNIIPIRTQLSILRERGILVDINVSGTNLFKKSLSWLETGIPDWTTDERLKYFTKGSKYVWDEAQAKELMSVITQMRQLLADSTYHVQGFHPFRYMPFTMHAHFVERWAILLGRFNSIKESMIENRDKVVDQLTTLYGDIAEDIFKALTSAKKARHVVIHYKNGKTETMDKDQWVSFVVENTVASIPTEAELEDRLSADYVTGLLYTDVDHIMDNVSLNEAHQDMLANNNGDPRITEMLRHEASRKQNVSKASPFMEVFSALREEMAVAAQDMLDKITQKDFVHGKVAKRAHGLLSVFNRKAAHTDEDLRRLLAQLREEAKSADDDTRSVENLKVVLEAIAGLKPTDIKESAFTAIEID